MYILSKLGTFSFVTTCIYLLLCCFWLLLFTISFKIFTKLWLSQKVILKNVTRNVKGAESQNRFKVSLNRICFYA